MPELWYYLTMKSKKNILKLIEDGIIGIASSKEDAWKKYLGSIPAEIVADLSDGDLSVVKRVYFDGYNGGILFATDFINSTITSQSDPSKSTMIPDDQNIKYN